MLKVILTRFGGLNVHKCKIYFNRGLVPQRQRFNGSTSIRRPDCIHHTWLGSLMSTDPSGWIWIRRSVRTSRSTTSHSVNNFTDKQTDQRLQSKEQSVLSEAILMTSCVFYNLILLPHAVLACVYFIFEETTLAWYFPSSSHWYDDFPNQLPWYHGFLKW